MNFSTYKLLEKINGYYYYFISHIDHLDLNFNIAESYADAMPDEPINQYFNIITGWSEDVDIEKCDNISPMQVLNKSFPTHHTKNMNISDEYKKLTEQAIEQLKQKKSRTKKPKDPNEEKPAKKTAKPRAKKSIDTNKVIIDTNKQQVSFD